MKKTQQELLDSFVWVTLKKPEDFLKVKETLERIGYASRQENTLYQSCHILHKKGRYAIVHFKELFLLDGKEADLSENDIGRRNAIAKLLEEWGLVSIVDKNVLGANFAPMSQIKVVQFRDKKDWNIVSKYSIGTKKSDNS